MLDEQRNEEHHFSINVYLFLGHNYYLHCRMCSCTGHKAIDCLKICVIYRWNDGHGQCVMPVRRQTESFRTFV